MKWLFLLVAIAFSIVAMKFARLSIMGIFPSWWKEKCHSAWYKDYQFDMGQSYLRDAPLLLKVPTYLFIGLLWTVYFFIPLLLCAELDYANRSSIPRSMLIGFVGSFYLYCCYWIGYKNGQEKK